jgi:hypothetical protein
MQQLAAQGIHGPAVIDQMVAHLPNLQRIWDGASDTQLAALCDEFPGFYQYAQLMEDAAVAERQKPTRWYDDMSALPDPLRQMMQIVLADAATIELGYQRCKSVGNPARRGADRDHLDAMYRAWHVAREDFLGKLRSPTAGVPIKGIEFLAHCLTTIVDGIERARADLRR